MANYWVDREQNHAKKRLKDENKIMKRLQKKHLEALDDIQEQIDAFYGRFASREGITMKEARKRVTKLDIDKYSKKAKRYVKERNFSKRANEEMRLYNVTMKVNRLELLKKNIELEVLSLYSDEEHEFYNEMLKMARDEYKRQSGILGETVYRNEKYIESIVNSSFLTAEWSDRLWTNQAALRAELDKLLTRGITQGINSRQLARELRKVIDSSVYNSERLLRTEFTRVQKDVFIDSMEQAEIEHYEYIAEPTACEICSELHGEIFRVKDAQPGVNIHPMHPFCRCSSAGYLSREEMEKDFESRGL